MYTGIERITPECPVLVAFRSLLGSLILLISILDLPLYFQTPVIT